MHFAAATRAWHQHEAQSDAPARAQGQQHEHRQKTAPLRLERREWSQRQPEIWGETQQAEKPKIHQSTELAVPQKHRPAKGTTLTPEICLHTDAADLTVEDACKTMAQRPPEDQVRIVTRSSTLEDSLVILIRRNQQHSLCRSDVAKRRGKQRKRGSGLCF